MGVISGATKEKRCKKENKIAFFHEVMKKRAKKYKRGLTGVYPRFSPIFTSIFSARFDMFTYFRLLFLNCRDLMYAAYTPRELTLHVFFLQTGKDLPGPRKHFRPHFFNMTVFWWKPGFSRFHPRTGLFLRV
jgi:hypothetical protein